MLVITMLTAALFAAESKDVLSMYNNSTHYIYEERVNVRDAPSLKSKKVGLALIGEPIKIIEKLDKIEELYGLKAHWYKVKWKGKTCYIWGGLISNIDVKADFDRDGKDEILMSRATGSPYHPDEYMVQYDHNIRLCRQGELISDTPFQGEVRKDSTFKVVEKKGFQPEVPLLNIYWAFGDGPGGARENNIYYWLDGQFKLLVKSNDSMLFYNTDEVFYIYPSDKDKGGKENILRLERRVTEYESEMGDKLIKDNLLEWVKEFRWDGKRFK